ncbi:thioredoxin [Candidatus Tremblaya phenacola]|uniref:Thioredoxin n=1 Tax=Candidatus Tremblayella phenacoccinincola TaxID=1010676 RepID=A0A2G0V786_9PROT|nr:thioredoxin [Candidatus Tremblaya phenacola]PHN16336.1 Thioredoxin-1 [Candidatus Tremblaya phenacola]
MSNYNITHLNDECFDKKIKELKGLGLVVFWAEWCGSCKLMFSVLNELIKELNIKVSIAKVNIDENNITAVKYEIRSIPTLLLFHDGKLIDNKIGALSKEQLKELITKGLNSN